MINNLQEKKFVENRIRKLENILLDLKERLLPDRQEQYNVMAEVYVRNIIELREEIQEYIGMDNILIKKSDINIHINGPAIGYGQISIGLLSSYLDNFKSSVRRNYGILHNRKKVPKSIAILTDFTLDQLAVGSINLSLSIPNNQIDFFENSELNESLKIYFELLKWISSREDNDNIDGIDSEVKARLLSNILKIIPDDKNISSIEVYGDSVQSLSKIRLDHQSKKFILNKIESINKEEKNICISGIIRELDLDKMTFCLRDIDCKGKEQIKCSMSKNRVDDLEGYLNSYVKVTGILQGNMVDVKYIDKLNKYK